MPRGESLQKGRIGRKGAYPRLNNCSELLTSFLWVGLQPDIGA
jgi:hypothetical protein